MIYFYSLVVLVSQATFGVNADRLLWFFRRYMNTEHRHWQGVDRRSYEDFLMALSILLADVCTPFSLAFVVVRQLGSTLYFCR